MCYHRQHRPFSDGGDTPPGNTRSLEGNDVVRGLRGRLADTEARLERARAREAELGRRLEEMKRFVSVMEILETYLRRRFREQQEQVARLFAPFPKYKVAKATKAFTMIHGERLGTKALR